MFASDRKEIVPSHIQVQWKNGGFTLVTVEEFHPYEPSAYVHDPGWSCFVPGSEREIFISQDGTVYDGTTNDVIGTALEIKASMDKRLEQMEEASRYA